MADTTPYPNLNGPKEFVWVEGVTPMTHENTLVAAIAVYLVVIFSLRAWMKDRKPYALKTAATIHNLILCLWSLAMSASCAYYIARLYFVHGYTVTDLFCDAKPGVDHKFIRGKLALVAWSYYVSKFYELLDTVLKVLKGKDLTFLHVYHHCIVMPLVFSWNRGHFSLQWWAIMVNTAVHVVMYYYYFVAGLVGKGYRPWWRVYITTFQLTQFVSVFVNIFVWYYISLENPKFNLSWPFLTYDSSKCSGDVWVVNFSQSVNVSFLFLFGQFFVANYLKKSKKKKDAKKTE